MREYEGGGGYAEARPLVHTRGGGGVVKVGFVMYDSCSIERDVHGE